MKKYFIIIITFLFIYIGNVNAQSYTYYEADTCDQASSVEVYDVSSDGLIECASSYPYSYSSVGALYCKSKTLFSTKVYMQTVSCSRKSFASKLSGDEYSNWGSNVVSSCDMVPCNIRDNLGCQECKENLSASSTTCSKYSDNETCENSGCTWSTNGCYYSESNYVEKYESEDSSFVETNSCESMLGDFRDDLISILKAMRIAGPVLVFALSVYDYVLALMSKDAEDMKKVNQKLIKRLALIVALFFVPTLVNMLMNFLDADYVSCING